MTSRRARTTAAVALAVAATTVAGLVGWRTASQAAVDRHLDAGFDGLSWLDTMDVGQEFTAGQIVLFHNTPRDLVVTDVRPTIREGSHLRFLGAFVAPESRPLGTTDRSLSFPPETGTYGPDVRPAGGYVLHPFGEGEDTRGTELLLGFEVTGEGRSHMESVTVDFTVDGARGSRTIDTTITVCAPADAVCDYPADVLED